MFIKNIRLVNFRNHKSRDTVFDKTTYISGPNGSGKTSIAEAVSVILALKSFKQNNLRKCITFNESGFFIESEVTERDFSHKVSLKYTDKKYLYVNNSLKKDYQEYLNKNFVFVYSPFNEGLLSNSQEVKRSFIDKVIFYQWPNYIHILKDFNKILSTKKKLLTADKTDRDYLNVLNESLVEKSLQISEARKNKLSELNSIFQKEFNGMFNDERFGVKFHSKVFDKKIFNEEIVKKTVLFGAHLDKIYYTLGGRVNDGFLSFGQRKTFALLCIKGVLLSLEDLEKNGIVILLDDFEVGLDSYRIKSFRSIFRDSQLIITGVENNHFKDAYNIKI